jgi:hypothetical protein
MNRTRRDEILYSAYTSRIKANEAATAAFRRAGSAEALAAAATELKATAVRLPLAAAGIRYRQFGILIEALSFLVRWASAVRSAEIDADRFLRSAKVAARDISRETGGAQGVENLALAASRISELSDVDGVPDIAQLLLSIPLPLPVFADVAVPARRERAVAAPRPSEIVVAFTSFQIDGAPFGDPQTIQPEILHDLVVAVTVSRWPEEANELVLEAMSVEPAASYELPNFSFERPTGMPPHALTQTGRLVLHYPTALYARPLQFAYKARFSPHGGDSQVLVQGQRHLRVQCFDPARDPQSGYVLVDKRVLEIRDEVRRAVAVSDTELNNFFLLLTAVGGIAGQSLQDTLFARKYSEKEFQTEMKKLLRQNPRIGSQLEEHPRAAGGITDLSFHGIRLELKVEPNQFVTKDGASSFIQQTAQYVAGSDRRLGVLALLDCSPKKEAPGSVANDIFATNVPPPGGSGLPICIGVVIIRGTLAKPSHLSRKARPRKG